MVAKRFRQSKRFSAKTRKKRDNNQVEITGFFKPKVIEFLENLICRSFVEIKQQEIIRYYRVKNSNKKNLLKFLVKTTQGELFYFFFCFSKKSTDSEFCLLDSTSHYLLVRVKPTISQDHLTQSIKENIQDQLIGFENEQKFLYEANQLCKYHNWMISFKKAPLEDDLNGIDKYLEYYDKDHTIKQMPFQLKSGEAGQNKHVIMFPCISSIKWREGLYGRNVFFDKIKKMVRSHDKNNIAHA